MLLLLRWRNLQEEHCLTPVFQAGVLFPKLSRNSGAMVGMLESYFYRSVRAHTSQVYLEGLAGRVPLSDLRRKGKVVTIFQNDGYTD